MDIGAESSASSSSTSNSGRTTFSSSCSIGEFVEEIDVREIQRSRPIGQGSFGVVWHAYWRNIEVAVKEIQSEEERKAFQAGLNSKFRTHLVSVIVVFVGLSIPSSLVISPYSDNFKPPIQLAVCKVDEYHDFTSMTLLKADRMNLHRAPPFGRLYSFNST
jgi:hypothetical protein